jgi:hypothetical protein
MEYLAARLLYKFSNFSNEVDLEKKRSSIESFFIGFAKFTHVEKVVNQQIAGRFLDWISRQYDLDKCEYGATLGGPQKMGETQPKEWFGKGKELPFEAFSRGNSLFGRRSFCKECESIINKDPLRPKRNRDNRRNRRNDPNYARKCNEVDKERIINNSLSTKLYLLRGAKQRAKIKGIEFTIDVSDIELPDYCPLLEIPMHVNSRNGVSNLDDSYSLDRIDSSKGYIKGNVWVISRRANVIKNNATLEELELLTNNLKKYWKH